MSYQDEDDVCTTGVGVLISLALLVSALGVGALFFRTWRTWQNERHWLRDLAQLKQELESQQREVYRLSIAVQQEHWRQEDLEGQERDLEAEERAFSKLFAPLPVKK